MKFSDLDLDPNVLRAIEDAGYTVPTPIQAEAIPHALKGRDILGIAQTGTGKTASFTLPMITMLAQGRARARMPRSLILCPTRELAAQVSENFETYGKHHKLTMALLIGGVSFKDQDKLIDRGVDVLIATPGRLLDHFERGKLMLTGVQVMVVDEADRMLDMGFIPDIERIFNLTPFTRQTLFFSATMPPEITRLTQTFLHNPVRVEVARQASVVDTVTQKICVFKPSRKDRTDAEKRDVLRGLLEAEKPTLTNAIIFCNRKRDVSVVHRSLVKHGYNAGALHGDLDQSVRTATLNGFRDNEITYLVASDVAARGLDIPIVSHVINFDVPIHSEDYVHRIGRTGRAGRAGMALTLSTPGDAKYLDRIEELTGQKIERIVPPGGTAPPAPAEVDETAADESRRPRRRSRKSDSVESPDNAGTETVQETRSEPAKESPVAQVDDKGGRSSPDRPKRERRPRKDKADGDRGRKGQVVGMGDHVPAFLLRPVPSRTTRVKDEDEDTSENSEAA